MCVCVCVCVFLLDGSADSLKALLDTKGLAKHLSWLKDFECIVIPRPADAAANVAAAIAAETATSELL